MSIQNLHASDYSIHDNRPMSAREWSVIALCAALGFFTAWAYSGFGPIYLSPPQEMREPTSTDAAYTVCRVLKILGTMETDGITLNACDVFESKDRALRDKGFGGKIHASVKMDSDANAIGMCRAIADYVTNQPELFRRLYGKLWSVQVSARSGKPAASCVIA
jgi:hypothetical protein